MFTKLFLRCTQRLLIRCNNSFTSDISRAPSLWSARRSPSEHACHKCLTAASSSSARSVASTYQSHSARKNDQSDSLTDSSIVGRCIVAFFSPLELPDPRVFDFSARINSAAAVVFAASVAVLAASALTLSTAIVCTWYTCYLSSPVLSATEVHSASVRNGPPSSPDVQPATSHLTFLTFPMVTSEVPWLSCYPLMPGAVRGPQPWNSEHALGPPAARS